MTSNTQQHQNNYVKIFDTTLRDGEQSPGFSMNLQEKIRLGMQLEKLGVDVIEAGFPAASPDDFKSVQMLAQKLKNPEICGLARAMESDLKTTWEAIKEAQKPRIHTFIATSPIHMEYKLKKTPEQVLEMAVKAVKYAKSLCSRVDFSPEDGGRSDRYFLVKILDAVIEVGADTINIPDTVGYLMPDEFGDLLKFLIANVKNADKVIWSTHCHDDLGLGVANSLAGVINGARQVECTINGIGERAGNASLEEVVMALRTRPDFYNLKTGIETTEIYNTSKLLEQITGQKVQPNKAIVGKNAFAHESGIHQHGMLANSQTYEIMTPESVGVDKTDIVLGKHSGSAALNKRLKDLGYDLEDKDLKQIFKDFKDLADKKKDITDSDLAVLVMGEQAHGEGLWELLDFEVGSGEKSEPFAEITLKNTESGEEKSLKKSGTGMVDGAYACIDEICGNPGELIEFVVDSVTSGINAQAIVNVRIELNDGSVLTGRSGDTNIIKAAILAYLDVVNKGLK